MDLGPSRSRSTGMNRSDRAIRRTERPIDRSHRRTGPADVGFMSTALFGAERQDYWRRWLADSGREQETAPAHARLQEPRTEIADLERRIERQVANLEAEDPTHSLRRRVGP